MEATATVGLVRPRAARRQLLCGCGGGHRGGAGAAAVERKAGWRRGEEEGVQEVRRSAVTERSRGDA
jgi:hypothetical protein